MAVFRQQFTPMLASIGAQAEDNLRLLRPFAPAREDQHLQIQKLRRREVVARLNHAIHHQQPSPRIHALAAGLQNLDAGIIRPIVENVLHAATLSQLSKTRDHSNNQERMGSGFAWTGAKPRHHMDSLFVGAAGFSARLLERVVYFRWRD